MKRSFENIGNPHKEEGPTRVPGLLVRTAHAGTSGPLKELTLASDASERERHVTVGQKAVVKGEDYAALLAHDLTADCTE